MTYMLKQDLGLAVSISLAIGVFKDTVIFRVKRLQKLCIIVWTVAVLIVGFCWRAFPCSQAPRE